MLYMNSYELSRRFFDWSYENPEIVTPNHVALYFFIIEHCNRLGWKEKFGLPTTMAKEAIGIKSYNTYIKCFTDLEKYGFIKILEKSKNQYSSNIIALSFFNKAHDKALDKALIKHSTKQSESTIQSIDSIDKQLNKEQYNNNECDSEILEENEYPNEFLKIEDCRIKYDSNYQSQKEAICMKEKLNLEKLKLFQDEFDLHVKRTETQKVLTNYVSHFANWTAKLTKEQKLEILNKNNPALKPHPYAQFGFGK